MARERSPGMLFENIDLVGTTLTAEDGSAMQLPAEAKARLMAQGELDAELQNLLHHHMSQFLAAVRTRRPELADGLGFIAFVFRPDVTVNVTNIRDRDYVRGLIKQLGKQWEEQDAKAR